MRRVGDVSEKDALWGIYVLVGRKSHGREQVLAFTKGGFEYFVQCFNEMTINCPTQREAIRGRLLLLFVR